LRREEKIEKRTLTIIIRKDVLADEVQAFDRLDCLYEVRQCVVLYLEDEKALGR
jgi:hypothetical protein